MRISLPWPPRPRRVVARRLCCASGADRIAYWSLAAYQRRLAAGSQFRTRILDAWRLDRGALDRRASPAWWRGVRFELLNSRDAAASWHFLYLLPGVDYSDPRPVESACPANRCAQ
jgi:hypothetical protein